LSIKGEGNGDAVVANDDVLLFREGRAEDGVLLIVVATVSCDVFDVLLVWGAKCGGNGCEPSVGDGGRKSGSEAKSGFGGVSGGNLPSIPSLSSGRANKAPMLGIGDGTAGVPGTVSMTAIALPIRAKLGRRGPRALRGLVGLARDSADPAFGCIVVHGMALLARKSGGGSGGARAGLCRSLEGGAGLLGARDRADELDPAAAGNDQPGAMPGRPGDMIGG